MRKLLLGLSLWLGAACAAFGQVNTVPQVGVTSGYVPAQTYSATWVGLASAASATDLVCISASSSKTVTVQSLRIGGSGTAITLPVTVLRRVSLDTGGTAATTTANPANTISRRVSTNGAATATLISYTANPTIVDTSPTYIDSSALSLAAAAASGSGSVLFDWAKDNENLLQPPTLVKGSTQQICLNLNATSITAPLLTGSISWKEE